MTETAMADPAESAPLQARLVALRDAEPNIRARDAAEKLGVSEGELLACRCGAGVQRLQGPWGDLIQALPGLGRVMALTRNDHAVHEKKGVFGNISIFGDRMGLVLNRDIDLRIFLGHWHFGFAVAEAAGESTRHSLQFFDCDGTAVHKIHLLEDSNRAGYDDLVARFLTPDQSPAMAVTPVPAGPDDRPDPAIDTVVLRDRWLGLRDVHDFHAMLDEVGTGRMQALRLVGRDLAWPVDVKSFRIAVTAAAAQEIPVMVFVGSPGVVQIHTGPVVTLRDVGPWFNILDPHFNLHLREDRIAGAWVVRKPTRDGIVTSLEIYDGDGAQIAWLFGERGEGKGERHDWRALVESLEGADA
ncbi:MAG: ChuX/HutX family heme-like substrate-binding protein [Alphaproteobacteria bacterium]